MQVSIRAFVDFDNLAQRNRSADGLERVFSYIFGSEDFNLGAPVISCEVRIYGGWYQENGLTKAAQLLSAQLEGKFPLSLRARGGELIKLTAAMAYSMSQDPTTHMLDTYRQKGVPSNLRCNAPGNSGCSQKACMFSNLPDLIKKKRCPAINCDIEIGRILYRGEQKIVDTMLACDVVHDVSLGSYAAFIIISGDDDMIPPIRSALLKGGKVIHVVSKLPIKRLNSLGSFRNYREVVYAA